MFGCTACKCTFEEAEDQKVHFRMEWHRYNLKRKVVGLAAVSLDQYNIRKEQTESTEKNIKKVLQEEAANFHAKCVNCNKNFTKKKVLEQHLTSKKHKDNLKKQKVVENVIISQKKKDNNLQVEQDETKEELSLEDMSLNEEQRHEEDQSTIPLALDDCIFCPFKANDVEHCIAHMLQEHGFFIPDMEYLEDLDGFLSYLGEKVKLGKYCLYCNGKGKAFSTYRDCQKHMIAKSHCKIIYEEDNDLEEYVDFYDFSSQYAHLDNDGDEEWETASENSDDDMDTDEAEVEDEDDIPLVEKTISISGTGEMVLLDGRRVGRREHKRYYKQRFRPSDERDSVLAVAKERLLLAYQEAGVDSTSTAISKHLAENLFKKRQNFSARSIKEQRIGQTLRVKHKQRLDFRSHKLQKVTNRKLLVCV